MIYRGFNKLEIEKITKILDRNGVVYQTGLPEEALEYMNDKSKRVDHRFMDNALQVVIEKEEFDKINAKDLQTLFDLRIYKEEDSPFTDEELANLGSETDVDLAKGPSQTPEQKRMNQIAAILAVVLVTLFFLWKNKII